MQILLACLALVAMGLTMAVLWAAWRRRMAMRRAQVRQQSFPAAWRALLEDRVGLYRRLPPPLRKVLHAHMLEFLDGKHFEGCGGLAMTEEIRLTIASLACVPLLGRTGPVYPELSSILVYPAAFAAPNREGFEGEELEEFELDGESWDIGAVVLAWDSIRREAPRKFHARNVVLHEFAHQLAREEGFADGSALMEGRSGPSRALRHEFELLQQRSARGITGLIDEYAATDPAEFFAVLTEVFFGQPRRLHQRHRQIYEAFQAYYGVNPLEWDDS